MFGAPWPGSGAVGDQMDLGRTDDLAVLLRDERSEAGVGAEVGDRVPDRVGGVQDVREGESADTGETLGVRGDVGAQGAHEHCHEEAPYGA